MSPGALLFPSCARQTPHPLLRQHAGVDDSKPLTSLSLRAAKEGKKTVGERNIHPLTERNRRSRPERSSQKRGINLPHYTSAVNTRSLSLPPTIPPLLHVMPEGTDIKPRNHATRVRLNRITGKFIHIADRGETTSSPNHATRAQPIRYLPSLENLTPLSDPRQRVRPLRSMACAVRPLVASHEGPEVAACVSSAPPPRRLTAGGA